MILIIDFWFIIAYYYGKGKTKRVFMLPTILNAFIFVFRKTYIKDSIDIFTGL